MIVQQHSFFEEKMLLRPLLIAALGSPTMRSSSTYYYTTYYGRCKGWRRCYRLPEILSIKAPFWKRVREKKIMTGHISEGKRRLPLTSSLFMPIPALPSRSCRGGGASLLLTYLLYISQTLSDPRARLPRPLVTRPPGGLGLLRHRQVRGSRHRLLRLRPAGPRVRLPPLHLRARPPWPAVQGHRGGPGRLPRPLRAQGALRAGEERRRPRL